MSEVSRRIQWFVGAFIGGLLLVTAYEKISVYPMMEHTLTPPFHSFDAGLENWMFSGATIAQKHQIVLNPGIAERHGVFWHKTAVTTKDLEFQAQINVNPSNGPAPLGEGFGFFYVSDMLNSTFPEQQFVQAKDWKGAMDDFGYNNGVGYKKQYKGLGVFFTIDQKGYGVVSAEISNADRDVIASNTAGRQQVNFDWRRAGQFTLYVRVGVDVEVSIRQKHPQGGTQDIVRRVLFQPSPGFDTSASLGFTSYSGDQFGSNPQNSPKAYDTIQIISCGAWDHDVNSGGYVGIDSEFDWASGVKNQKDQKEAIEALTAAINRHINELQPKEEQMMRDISALQDRVQKLHDDVSFFSTEVQYTMGKGSPEDHLKALKDNVGSFKNILSNTAEQHKRIVDDVHGKIEEKQSNGGGTAAMADAIRAQNKGLVDQLESQNAVSRWFLIALFAAIVLIGLGFYQRMRYYEKKHFI